MDWWASIDAQTKAGILGQLAGHGVVWSKQVLGGKSVSQVLNPSNLYWAVFNIGSEYLTAYATSMLGTPIGGVAVPAGVQYLALTMYDPTSKRVAADVMGGRIGSLLDSPYLAGTVGSVIAKSYA